MMVKVTLLPVNAGFGEAVFEMDKSAAALTSTPAKAELLAEAGSAMLEVTAAMLKSSPGEVAATVIVMVAVALLARLPMLQVTVLPFVPVVPWVVCADTKASPEGSASVNTIFVAVDGPWLVTTMV